MKYVLIIVIIIGITYFVFKLTGSVLVGKTILTPGAPYIYNGANEFTCDILRADDPKDQSVNKGIVTEQQFSDLFDHFPWKEQLDLANKINIQSATISVHDQLRKMTLFISVSTSSATGNIGYIIGLTNNVPGSKKDTVALNGTGDMEQVHELIKKFFHRESDIKDFLLNVKN
jgi:hypothetical protein